MRGAHSRKAWSEIQAVLANCSAESELYGFIEGACEGLSVNSLLRDVGRVEPKVCMHRDPFAGRGIIERKGLSTAHRHRRPFVARAGGAAAVGAPQGPRQGEHLGRYD